ncbi:putative F-box/LRR-repeat protein At5g41840 [Brassica napus]|uniref:putative F-box/LRR-repeat protein At5g41840 n=1 Tax=Brassica napus TaxID=3708 RepID=UPI000BBF287E|nr:putative F-box/LRR-repeat protein At5g41840 [Brassica napus]
MSSKDYMSGLPDCLISHILSFVSNKEAASTSVLAKRWRYLFALTRDLHFDDFVYLNPEKKSKTSRSFVDFVDRVLVLHQNVPLNRFSLKCEDVIHPAIITSWLLKVMDRGVLDLDLQIISSDMDCPLPSEMFVSETLVKLFIRICGVLAIDKDKDVFLPKVKTLRFDHVIVKNNFFRKLLLGC